MKVLYSKSSHETNLLHPYLPAYDYINIWTSGPKFYLIKEPMTQEQELMSATGKKGRKAKLVKSKSEKERQPFPIKFEERGDKWYNS